MSIIFIQAGKGEKNAFEQKKNVIFMYILMVKNVTLKHIN